MTYSVNNIERIFLYQLQSTDNLDIPPDLKQTIDECVQDLEVTNAFEQSPEKKSLNKRILHGLYTACYIKIHPEAAIDNARAKASQLFAAMLDESSCTTHPQEYIRRTMHDLVMRCWYPERHHTPQEQLQFLENHNYILYDKCSRYIYNRLANSVHGLDITTSDHLSYYLGLSYPAQMHLIFSDQELAQINAKNDLSKIDAMCNRLTTHPLKNKIPQMLKALANFEGRLNEEMNAIGAGEIKKDILGMILEFSFWRQLKAIAEKNLSATQFDEEFSALMNSMADNAHARMCIDQCTSNMVKGYL